MPSSSDGGHSRPQIPTHPAVIRARRSATRDVAHYNAADSSCSPSEDSLSTAGLSAGRLASEEPAWRALLGCITAVLHCAGHPGRAGGGRGRRGGAAGPAGGQGHPEAAQPQDAARGTALVRTPNRSVVGRPQHARRNPWTWVLPKLLSACYAQLLNRTFACHIHTSACGLVPA